MDAETESTFAALRRREREFDPFDALPGIADDAAENWSLDPAEGLREILRCTWHDLQNARRRAANGKWSIECESLVERVMGLTRIVGPIEWSEIPVDLLLDGWYQRIHEAIGVDAPFSDADRARAQDVFDRRSR